MSQRYRYYDSPDGYDLFHKTQYICRRVAVASSTYALTDIILITQPKTYFSMAERFIRLFAAPIIGGAIFTTTVYIATNIRKRDDSWNHCLGGLATTLYANRILKNTPLAWIVGCPLILTLCIYKDMKMLKGDKFLVHDDTTDNLMNIGTPVIEYDLKRNSIYADKKSFVYADWFN